MLDDVGWGRGECRYGMLTIRLASHFQAFLGFFDFLVVEVFDSWILGIVVLEIKCSIFNCVVNI